MATKHVKHKANKLGGFDAFLTAIRRQVATAQPNKEGTQRFVLAISDQYAAVRPQDIFTHPLRFLKQAAGEPPIQFGNHGFKKALVDDDNPARHYTAFIFIGFWLPNPLGVLVLWTWEILGFLRYGF